MQCVRGAPRGVAVRPPVATSSLSRRTAPNVATRCLSTDNGMRFPGARGAPRGGPDSQHLFANAPRRSADSAQAHCVPLHRHPHPEPSNARHGDLRGGVSEHPPTVEAQRVKEVWLHLHGHDVAHAVACLDRGDWFAAAERFTDLLIGLDPALQNSALAGELWCHLAEALAAQGQAEEALVAAQRALERLSTEYEHPPALTALARAMALTPGLEAKAEALASRLASGDPPHAPAALLAAEIAVARSDPRTAAKWFQHIRTHAPPGDIVAVRAQMLEAKFLLRLGHAKEALPLLHALADVPASNALPYLHVEAAVLHAGLLLLSGRFEAGTAALGEALLRSSAVYATQLVRGNDKVPTIGGHSELDPSLVSFASLLLLRAHGFLVAGSLARIREDVSEWAPFTPAPPLPRPDMRTLEAWSAWLLEPYTARALALPRMAALRQCPLPAPSEPPSAAVLRTALRAHLLLALSAQLYPAFTSYEAPPRLLRGYATLAELAADLATAPDRLGAADFAAAPVLRLGSLAAHLLALADQLVALAQATGGERSAAWHILEDFAPSVRRAVWFLRTARGAPSPTDAAEASLFRTLLADSERRPLRLLVLDAYPSGAPVASLIQGLGVPLVAKSVPPRSIGGQSAAAGEAYDLVVWNGAPTPEIHSILVSIRRAFPDTPVVSIAHAPRNAHFDAVLDVPWDQTLQELALSVWQRRWSRR